MEKAINKEEAVRFFINNSSGSLLCLKDGEKKKCNSYPEALKFFEKS